MLVVVVVVMVAMNALARAVGVHTSSSLFAFTIGVVVTATVFVLGGVIAIFSGGVNWIVGGQAERWTEEVLEDLGPNWRIANNLVFRHGTPPDTWDVDVDHVAVGPGGVVVVESKYSSVPVDLDAGRLSSQVRKDADQAARNVQRVRGLLEAMPECPPVTALLVYWGFRPRLPKEPILMAGRTVKIVMGADADRWLPTVTKQTVGLAIQDEAWRMVKGHV
jgi:hypothetical protein